MVPIGQSAGRIDLADLMAKTSDATAAIYVETPNYLGVIETDAPEIVDIAHRLHAETVISVDPLSVGLLGSPFGYGADVVLQDGATADRVAGETIFRNCMRVAAAIGEIPGLRIRWPGFFREFVVDFNDAGVEVGAINDVLRTRGLTIGKDLSSEFPALGQAALCNTTEVHDLAALTEALNEAITGSRQGKVISSGS